jgi:hypothetical protein
VAKRWSSKGVRLLRGAQGYRLNGHSGLIGCLLFFFNFFSPSYFFEEVEQRGVYVLCKGRET